MNPLTALNQAVANLRKALDTMPSEQDLRDAVANAKAAVEAAAVRVANAQNVAQDVIDDLATTKSEADAILPA